MTGMWGKVLALPTRTHLVYCPGAVHSTGPGVGHNVGVGDGSDAGLKFAGCWPWYLHWS